MGIPRPSCRGGSWARVSGWWHVRANACFEFFHNQDI